MLSRGVELYIVGDGPMRDELKTSDCAAGVIYLIGNSNALSYYRASDMFVLPSFSEGLSLSSA